MEENLNFKQMEEDLIFWPIEDDLNLLVTEKQSPFSANGTRL
jgi:hypothetical protein